MNSYGTGYDDREDARAVPSPAGRYVNNDLSTPREVHPREDETVRNPRVERRTLHNWALTFRGPNLSKFVCLRCAEVYTTPAPSWAAAPPAEGCVYD